MDKFILVGCDLHDKNMVLKLALNREVVHSRTFANDSVGRASMVQELRKHAHIAGEARIVVAYEASSLGFFLRDFLEAQAIVCHVFAPSKIARSPKQRRCKTDAKDAEALLEILRGHYLAGNKLPAIWIPDELTRDHRELVRARLDAQDKCSAVKTQIRTFIKRQKDLKDQAPRGGWTLPLRAWLKTLAECGQPLGLCARQALASLLRQNESLEREIVLLDAQLAALAEHERYRPSVTQLKKLKGVGVLSALVFLVEMGSLTRFANRRKLGAFIGLVPDSDESGEDDDHKGHITHQGPARVRYVLCQAVWNRVRHDPQERLFYQRLVAKNPKRKKIAVVASMRRLAIKMWHTCLAAQSAA
jgi:transposase